MSSPVYIIPVYIYIVYINVNSIFYVDLHLRLYMFLVFRIQENVVIVKFQGIYRVSPYPPDPCFHTYPDS